MHFAFELDSIIYRACEIVVEIPDFSMSELVTLSISVVKSIFGMINSSLHSDILRLQINHILWRDFFYPHDNLKLLVVIQQHVYIA